MIRDISDISDISDIKILKNYSLIEEANYVNHLYKRA